jgi:hypothetical protein
MRFIFTTVMALAATATIAAQQTTPSKPAQTSASGDHKSITVTGCLQTAVQPNQFVLTNTADALAKGVAVAVSGAVPSVTYQLSGGSNLAAHVGHRVEITGTTSGKAQKAVTSGTSVRETEIPGRPDPKVETKEKAAIEIRDLNIQSLKMVSTSCATK